MKTQRSTPRLFCRSILSVSLLLTMAATTRADYHSTVLADTPLAFYPLNLAVDTSGTATDVSGNGNNGTYVNIASGNNSTGPSAYITNAVAFNGTDTSVDLSSAASLTSLSGAATLEAWVKPADSTSFGDIIGKGYDSSTFQESYMRVDGPYGAVYDVNLGNAQITGGQQVTNWTHVVLANDGTNTSFYINGLLIQSKSDSVGALSFSDPWAIGNGTSAGNSRHFNGNITEVAIYGHGLTAAQVLNHYCVGLVGVPSANAAPIIDIQPQSQQSFVGGTLPLSVTAVSALPMTNQWYFGNSPLSGKTNATLTLTNLQLTNAGNYSVVVGNANGTATSSVAVVTVATPRNLRWSANANTGAWDNTTANWINLASSLQTAFDAGDAVLFDDTPGVPTTVAVTNTVVPSVVNVNATNNSYTFNGPSGMSGYGSIIKSGPSTLNIFTPSGFAGSVAIKGGLVYAGNNCFRSVSSISVTNGTTLDLGGGGFNNLTPITLAGSGVSGQGALINSYNDSPGELVNLIMTGDTLLGGSARWDMASGSQINGAHNLSFDMSGAGGYGQWNGVSIGANVPQITVANASSLGLTSMDTSCQNPATLFNISTNGQLVLYSGGFNGSVNLYNCAQMTVYSASVNLAGSTLHIYSGATMHLYAQGIAMTGNNLIFEDRASLQTYYNSGNNPINNLVTLNGVVHLVLGDHSESFNNVISGVGGFVLDYYNNQMILSASNTYTGPTIIGSSGNTPAVALTGNGSISHSSLIFFGGSDASVVHVDATGRSDQNLTLAGGQTLAGIGAINGGLVVSPGATVSPAGTNTTIGITVGSNPVGRIIAYNDITLAGTTVLKLNGNGGNDMLQSSSSIHYGGTLNLVNISGSPMAAGQTFQIFDAGAISGSFATITPAVPGTGLAWDTSQLSNGLIGVITVPVFTSAKVSGGNLVLSGSGGTANGNYVVLSSTNVVTPVINWVPVATNAYDSSGNFTWSTPILPGVHRSFFMIRQ
jgi:hypothetical protein